MNRIVFRRFIFVWMVLHSIACGFVIYSAFSTIIKQKSGLPETMAVTILKEHFNSSFKPEVLFLHTDIIALELLRSRERRHTIEQRFKMHELLYASSKGKDGTHFDAKPSYSLERKTLSFLNYELSPMKHKMTAVLPATLEHFDLLSNFAVSCKMTNPNISSLFDVIWIVVPDMHYTKIYESLLRTDSLHPVMRVVCESWVLPEQKMFQAYNPWLVQQDIKLAISAFIRTDYYLCFDADVMCGRELHYEDLFATDGRARTSEERALSFFAFTSGNLNKTCTNAKLPPPIVKNNTRMMAFTPLPVHTHILFSLASFLENREGEPWLQYLIRLHIKNKKWTEYTLYWAYAIFIRAYHRFHYPISTKEFCGTLPAKSGFAYKWFSQLNHTNRPPFVGVNDHDKSIDIVRLSAELRTALLKPP
ncbi:unnamed protein product [Rotaria socialis]|uniref:Uncharacterized protein n=1 Tax=Rotaria socialis TaxID=392032 RepID=A0A821QUA5_9BILA|nr:unnamed protein product [Rotaria socialis]CAF4830716.1 unnamed protein product [Rotaria socialis]